MKRKLLYAALLIVCIGFFSFREAGKCNGEDCAKKCISKKTVHKTAGEEWNLSPLYNFLKI